MQGRRSPDAGAGPAMTTTATRMRAWQGPAILGGGFRPFFLGAAIWAALAMALWVPMIAGALDLPTRFAPIDWHVHALLYGYLPAVLAGFLLTAVPNWTGRLPVVGLPLLGLVLLWAAGRVAVAVSAFLPAGTAAAIDLAFLAVFAAVAGREIVAGRNWRNLVMLAALALLWTGNLLFHLDATSGAAARGPGARLGIAVGVFMILLVGGRIVPSFTRNWLARRGPGALPAPMGRFDGLTLAISALALATFVALPVSVATAALCLLAAAANFARLGRWAGWRTMPEPLVAILHAGFAFAPLGFLVVGVAILAPGIVTPGAALHTWTAGAIAVMTLAVMTRASLGHSGRPLTADRATQAIYAAAIGAALLRLLDGLAPGHPALVHGAGALWIAAFAGFALAYGRLLLRPRVASRHPNPPATIMEARRDGT